MLAARHDDDDDDDDDEHWKLSNTIEYCIVKNGVNTKQNQFKKKSKKLLLSGTLLSKLIEK